MGTIAVPMGWPLSHMPFPGENSWQTKKYPQENLPGDMDPAVFTLGGGERH
jgi:hypothetical protein